MNQTYTTRDGVTRTLGYAIEKEDREYLEEHGEEPRLLMQRFKNSFPVFNTDVNPLDILTIKDQGQVGSCQGQSLAMIFTICYFLATGRVEDFSAMAAYILSQAEDGLLGKDVGSTLSGGQAVARRGLCLESAWPYTGRYDTRQPSGIEFPFKLSASKPTNDPEIIFEALEMGLPVQIGIAWTPEMDREHVTSYRGGRGGGHAVVWWLKYLINSWGSWNGDGMSTYERRALEEIVNYPGNTFVIYAPDGMEYPEVKPAGLE